MRFIRILAFTVVVAGVVVTAAAAIAFTDASFFTPEGEVGEPYTHMLDGRGGTRPYTFEVINGSLPPGLTLRSDGLISGTPTAAGKFSFWVNLRDDFPGAPQAQREFTINILARLFVTTNSAPPGTVGVPYNLPVQAAGGGTQTWSISAGALPPGLTIGATDGVISGTPTTAGSFAFTVFVRDPKRSDTKNLTIDVRTPVSVTPPTFRPAEVSAPFSAKLAASGGSGVYTWAAGGLPSGLALAADGTISGTPLAAGSLPVTATVTDSEGRTATLNATLKVAARLAIATKRFPQVKVGRPFEQTLRTRGGLGPFKFKVTEGRFPKGLRLDRTTGEISGTTRRPGRYPITFEVRDSLRVVAEKTLALVVVP